MTASLSSCTVTVEITVIPEANRLEGLKKNTNYLYLEVLFYYHVFYAKEFHVACLFSRRKEILDFSKMGGKCSFLLLS